MGGKETKIPVGPPSNNIKNEITAAYGAWERVWIWEAQGPFSSPATQLQKITGPEKCTLGQVLLLWQQRQHQ